MSYFIFDEVLELGREFELEGEEARHILKSRRMRKGTRFQIQDQNGQRYWVYRDGFFCPEKPPNWYLHGFFA